MLRDLLAVYPGYVPLLCCSPWNSTCRLYGGNVMKKDEFENLMLCRLDKCFKRYAIKHYLFILLIWPKNCYLFCLNCPLRFSV